MLRKTVLVRALSIAFSAAALSAAVMQPAAAQSNAAGSVYGRVAPGAATSVQVRNLGTNQTRTLQIGADGTFTASALAIGRYRATLQGGTAAGQAAEVDVIAGQGVEAVFAAVTPGVQQVQVTGRRSRIDVTNAANGATFTARELERLPIAKSVDAIIQLAPNTTKSDPTYIAGASIGGGGPSENAYYINGMPVTNPLTQLGASELPFGAIAQAEIKTGGYGAEFGRSVGGVINIVGKSGTNNWEVGGLASISPKKLRSDARDIYFPDSGLANSGKLRFRNQENTIQQTQLGAYVGGPIIQDKLFMFAALEQTETEANTVIGNASTPASALINGHRERETSTQRYYAKLDFNITDNHRLELTALGDTPTVDETIRGYNFTTSEIGKVSSTRHEESAGNAAAPNGGETQILRYTGNLTDNFTVTGLIGQTKITHIIEPGGYDPTMPGVVAASENRVPGLNYTSPQNFTGSLPFSGSTDDVKFKRIDLEYKLGNHTLRAGIDDIEVASLNAGNLTAGGFTWTYQKTTNPTAPINTPGGTVPPVAGHGPLSDQGYYVTKTIFRTASNAYASQNAQYIEDQWKVTKDLLVTIGVRNESFANENSDRVKYLEQKNTITPRLSAVWDVRGDASLKVFGSAGRYTVQMPTVVALRGANGSLNTTQYFSYTGTDQNGLPTGVTQLTPPLSANGEFGQAKDPKTVASTNLKPSQQDELTLGFEQAYSPSLNFGAKITYRSLGQTIDDFCDGRPFRRYALDNKIPMAGEADWDPEHGSYPYFGCAAFNPGTSQDFLIDFMQDGNYRKVTLTKEQLGFEKVKRVYAALDLFAEHPFRNGWYGKLNYTLGRSTGNTEGQTLSDLNTGQADVAATTTWDYSELMRHANGLLPNDRKHQIKAFGFYELTPQWIVGGNLAIQSGRPRGCLGGDPNPKARPDWMEVGASPNYGVEHYCFGVASVGADGKKRTSVDNNVPAPRGTMGRLPWTKSLDMNVVFRPAVVKNLSLKLDVFNVFNTQDTLKVNEQYNSGTNQSTLYGGVSSYQAPRSMKLTAEYNHRF